MELLAAKNDQEILSPKEFLDLSASRKADIIETNIIPSQLGENNFGKIQVKYATPIYKVK